MRPKAPPEGKQRRVRLKATGSAILEVFYLSYEREPNTAEAKELLQRVQEVPGCQSFDLQRLRLWFYRKRRQLSMNKSSLTAESIQHLEALLEDHRPSDKLMFTWAILLKANLEDVKAWVLDHHSEEPTEPFQMPTPHNSTSPEPLALKAESPLLQQKEVHVLNKRAMDADMNTILLDAVLEATITKTEPGPDTFGKSPCDASEFCDMFAPYEEKMESIISLLT